MANSPELEAEYLAFFDEFNHQRFFEAHEELEELWLPARQTDDGHFYKGLIQVAGAFVHLQHDRIGPAIALLKLARTNLSACPAQHRRFDVEGLRALLQRWLDAMEQGRFNPLRFAPPPRLELVPEGK